MQTADQIEARAVRWLWRERIPIGMLTTVAGRPGQGKSLFTMKLAAEISHHATVIASFHEDPVREVVRPRLEASGADLSKVITARFTFTGKPECLDMEALELQIRETGAKLVLIDPIASHLGVGINRSNDSIRKVSDPLQKIAEETECAIVFVDHVVKHTSPRAHPLQSIGGSGSGLSAAVRVAFIVGQDPDDDERIVVCMVKDVGGAKPAIAYTLDSRPFHDKYAREGSAAFLTPQEGEFEFNASRLLVVPANERGNNKGKMGRPGDKRASAAQWLTEYLRAAPGHMALKDDIEEDARQRGITRATLRRAREDMALDISHGGKGGKQTFWGLNAELVEALEAGGE